jgi:hypothetical protein
MVTLTTGMTFLLFTFGCGEFYEGGQTVRRPPMRWSAIVESLRNTAVGNGFARVKDYSIYVNTTIS